MNYEIIPMGDDLIEALDSYQMSKDEWEALLERRKPDQLLEALKALSEQALSQSKKMKSDYSLGLMEGAALAYETAFKMVEKFLE